MDIVKGNMGWIEVVVGPMFSGKSEELIRRLRRAEIGRQRHGGGCRAAEDGCAGQQFTARKTWRS